MSEKRSELESIATEAVQRKGMQNLSFRVLAEKAGVKSSSVHYYFPEKSDLTYALIDNYINDFQEKLEFIERKHSKARNKLDAFVSIFEKLIKSEKFCLCGMMAAEVALLNDENKVLLKQYFKLTEDWLFQLFKQNKSQLATSLKPRVLARLVMSGLEGAILIDRVDGKLVRLSALRELIRTFFK